MFLVFLASACGSEPAGPDAALPDRAIPDTSVDVLRPDTVHDAGVPDLKPDIAPDLKTDVALDSTPDVTPDLEPDAKPDMPDAKPWPDTAPWPDAVPWPDAKPWPDTAPWPDAVPWPDACVPATCKSLGKNCGSVADGCGKTLSCGSCATGQVCGWGGANVCGSAPPDPKKTAPPLDRTVATTVHVATSFLYSGKTPLQVGVKAGAIEPARAAALRGRVLDKAGKGLSGVKVTVVDRAKYGHTITRADGAYDLAVNGGGLLTLDFSKSGYLPARRRVDLAHQEWTQVPDLRLIQLDSKVTTVLAMAPTMQVARGSAVTDKAGTRQATLLFSAGTVATMVLPGGKKQTLTNLKVRATEYTVGAGGPEAMPAPLPPRAGYTYCVELSVDAALAAKASTVTFSKPVINYTENFLGFPVGGAVPVGYFDRKKDVWVPSADGRVVRIVGTKGGLAELDIDGKGFPASAAALTKLGVTTEERKNLATTYKTGQSLWRVALTHFSIEDYNNAYKNPDGAKKPKKKLPDKDNKEPKGCNTGGSIIECANQVLGERLPVVGAPLSLNYRSDRTDGRKLADTLQIPLTGATIPKPLKRVDLELIIAGRTIKKSFLAKANQSYSFVWDGKDVYGRRLQGRQPITVRLGYVYDGFYYAYKYEPNASPAFGTTKRLVITKILGRKESTLWQTQKAFIGHLDARELGLGGWTPSGYHWYNPLGRELYLGNGEQRTVESHDYVVITTVAGTGKKGSIGDGGKATKAQLAYPTGVAVDRAGNVYIADLYNWVVRKVDQKGIITTVAGTGAGGALGDGGPAVNASLVKPYDVAVDSRGNLYIADRGHYRIRKVDTSGIITTVAGNGKSGYSGDDGPAVSASITEPFAVAADDQGNVYFTSHIYPKCSIRRVGADGIITTVAGAGCGSSGDGKLATAAQFSNPVGLSVDARGNLYIADYKNRIRKVGADGLISTVAGTGKAGFSGDHGPATLAKIWMPVDAVAGPGGNLYIADYANRRVRIVDPSGTIATLAGTGKVAPYNGDRRPALTAPLSYPRRLAADRQGNVYVADHDAHRVYKLSSAMPGFTGANIAIPSGNGRYLYRFDLAGKHQSTVDTLTKATVSTFTHDAKGRLVKIVDGDGNVTTIQRDAKGKPVAIKAPFGQVTSLKLDSKGYLASVINPAGEMTQMSYSADGLMSSFTDPRGNSATFVHDVKGRLLKDSDPAGGLKTLARTVTSAGRKVSTSTALGRVTSDQVDYLSGGRKTYTRTFPSGVKTVTQGSGDSSSTTTYPDGTKVSTTSGPDPRFGMRAPVTTSRTRTTPGKITTTVTRSVQASLTDTYNPLSMTKLTRTTSVNGRTYTSVFDAAKRRWTSTTPAGRKAEAELDKQGRRIWSQAGGLAPSSSTFDKHGRLSKLSRGTGAVARIMSFSYDSSGNVAGVTDALWRTVSFSHDAAGRVTQSMLPGGRKVSRTYDKNSNLLSVTPPGKTAHSFTYDKRNLVTSYVPPAAGSIPGTIKYAYNKDRQLTQVSLPSGKYIKYAYDAAGRTSTVTIPSGKTTYTYDAKTGQLASATSPDNVTTSYTYDGSLVTKITYSGAVKGTISYTYDKNGRVASQSVNGKHTVNYTYDKDGLVIKAGAMTITRDPNSGLITDTALGKVTTARTYNAFGELIMLTAKAAGATIFTATYTRDALGRITQNLETVQGVTTTWAYAYDTAGRLIQRTKNGKAHETYTYDQNGNRTSYTDQYSKKKTATYDARDRLLKYGSTTYSYNAEGDLIGKKEPGGTPAWPGSKGGPVPLSCSGPGQTDYVYDGQGNLISASLPNGTTIEFGYDAQGRQVIKKINGKKEKEYLYGNESTFALAMQGTKLQPTRYVNIPNTGTPLYITRGKSTFQLFMDDMESTRLVVDTDTGKVEQHKDYGSYGQATQDTNPGFQDLGYQGGFQEENTLLLFGCGDNTLSLFSHANGVYDPQTARTTTTNPSAVASGGSNGYSVGNGDPVNNGGARPTRSSARGSSPTRPSARGRRGRGGAGGKRVVDTGGIGGGESEKKEGGGSNGGRCARTGAEGGGDEDDETKMRRLIGRYEELNRRCQEQDASACALLMGAFNRISDLYGRSQKAGAIYEAWAKSISYGESDKSSIP